MIADQQAARRHRAGSVNLRFNHLQNAAGMKLHQYRTRSFRRAIGGREVMVKQKIQAGESELAAQPDQPSDDAERVLEQSPHARISNFKWIQELYSRRSFSGFVRQPFAICRSEEHTSELQSPMY